MLKELVQAKLKQVKPEKMEDFSEDKEFFPSLHLDSDNLSEVKDWEVDGEYILMLRVKQTSKNMRTVDGKEIFSAGFDIREIGVLTEKDLEHDSDHNSSHSSLKKKYV